jgi:hypothetical protein
MKFKLILLCCFAMVGLQGCKAPMANAPELPPLVYSPTISPAQAAIGNSNYIDSAAQASQSAN